VSKRKTLKLHASTKARLDKLKRDGETWDEFLECAADALNAEQARDQYSGAPRCSDCGEIAHLWTIRDGQLLCGACSDE